MLLCRVVAVRRLPGHRFNVVIFTVSGALGP